MTTLILFIGSPWSKDRDNLDTLFDLLGREPLDPTFEEYGDFIAMADQAVVDSYNRERKLIPPMLHPVHVWGNFFNYSCAFSFYTDDDELIRKLAQRIHMNKQTSAYIEARAERRIQVQERANRERALAERRQRR